MLRLASPACGAELIRLNDLMHVKAHATQCDLLAG
jgi:hypothetical protein